MTDPDLPSTDSQAWLEARFGPERMLLNLREVAGVLGLAPDSLRRAIVDRRSNVPAFKIHGRYRVSMAAFAEWLERQNGGLSGPPTPEGRTNERGDNNA